MAKTETATTITCAVCGLTYNPAENTSCSSCPLHSGCSMTCCPNCGGSNINPAGSRLAAFLQKILPGGKPNAQSSHLP
jgi:hypothetical protein